MDKTKIAKIANKSVNTKAMFKHFTQGRRPKKTGMELRRRLYIIRNTYGVKLSVDDFHDCFKELEKAGVGKCIYDNTGYMSHFKWAVDMHELGLLGLGGEESPKEVSKKESHAPANASDEMMKLGHLLFLANLNKAQVEFLMTILKAKVQ